MVAYAILLSWPFILLLKMNGLQEFCQCLRIYGHAGVLFCIPPFLIPDALELQLYLFEKWIFACWLVVTCWHLDQVSVKRSLVLVIEQQPFPTIPLQLTIIHVPVRVSLSTETQIALIDVFCSRKLCKPINITANRVDMDLRFFPWLYNILLMLFLVPWKST